MIAMLSFVQGWLSQFHDDEKGQTNVPQWVWFLIVLVAIFAIVVLVGGSCTIGDRSIGTK